MDVQGLKASWNKLSNWIKYPLLMIFIPLLWGVQELITEESKAALVTVAKSFVPTYDYLLYLKLHPIRLLLSILACLSAGTVLAITVFFFKKASQLAYINSRLSAVQKSFGIEAYWDSKVDYQVEQAWDACRQSILKLPTSLKIMGASGWKTFASPEAPMHSVLKEYRGSVQILLMDPESPYLHKRALSLNIPIDSYKKEIKQSIEFLQTLRSTTNPKIDLKLYKHPLIWKIIQTPSFMWLQHYVHGKHVDTTPVYAFACTSSRDNSTMENTSLYIPMAAVFDKRWDLDGDLTSNQILS